MLFEQNGVGGIRSGFKRLTFLCVPDGIEVGEGHGAWYSITNLTDETNRTATLNHLYSTNDQRAALLEYVQVPGVKVCLMRKFYDTRDATTSQYGCDNIILRYADVLLMLSELTGDAQYMNQVQARAGVPQTAYSLTALQNERRWEFCLEGLRFNDMRRWSGAAGHSESSYAAKALQAQDGKMIVCLGDKANKRPMRHMTCSWSKRYADTKGFLPKPQAQIVLMNDGMVQNEGWNLDNPDTQYKVLY